MSCCLYKAQMYSFCKEESESRDHLVFKLHIQVLFGSELRLEFKLNQGDLVGRMEETTRLQQRKFSVSLAILVKIALGTTVWSCA